MLYRLSILFIDPDESSQLMGFLLPDIVICDVAEPVHDIRRRMTLAKTFQDI